MILLKKKPQKFHINAAIIQMSWLKDWVNSATMIMTTFCELERQIFKYQNKLIAFTNM